MTLHTVNKNHPADALANCLQVAGPDDAVVLIENGVYNAVQNTVGSALLLAAIEKNIPLYLLITDAKARGVSGKLIAACKMITDEQWVTLATEHDNMAAWF